jgi:hypothetical protein
MALWTLIHKETKEFIRFNKIYVDDETAIQHYFYYNPAHNRYFPIWTTDTDIYFQKIFKYIPECESFFHETPCTDKIDINQFEILKLL